MSNITIQNVILSYPHLTEKWAGQEWQTPKYSATVIFPEKSDMAPVMAAIEAAAKEKWPTNTPEFTQPWKQVKDGHYQGCWSFTAKDGTYAPQVVDAARQPILDARQVFAGCKMHISVSFYGTTTGGGNRVAVGLGPIMIVDSSEEMPRLAAAGMTVDDAFGNIEGAPAPLSPAPSSAPTATSSPTTASPGAPTPNNPLAS